ncbi:MAG: monooxygenase [Proteobacteria bacterium]|jgi:hypothetical protein|nr:monooxygenase [Pseudomonadota bacterium]
MITEVVLFRLPEGMTREQVVGSFKSSAPMWREPAELVRKYYLYDGAQGGGVYLWTSRAAAEQWHGQAFRERIRARFGNEPTFAYYESPVIVDNAAGEIVTDAA